MSKLVFLNPNDRPTMSSVILWAGQAYGSDPTHFLYYGELDDALDEVIDWLADEKNGHKGVLCNEQVESDYRAYIEEHKAEYPDDGENDEDLQDKARCSAECDCTTGGNCGDYIMSDSWGIYAENPSRQQVKELIADLQAKNYDNSSVVVIC
jgi:hypothetical protein